MNGRVRGFAPRVGALVLLATVTGHSDGGVIDLKFAGWKVDAPNGYDISSNGAINQGNNAPLGALLLDLTADWKTMDPVRFKFFDDWDTKKAPSPPDRLFLNLKLTNKTGKDWNAFSIAIKDDNGTAPFDPKKGTGGNALHPTAAHIHVNYLDPNGLAFTKLTANPSSESVADLTKDSIVDVTRGLYSAIFSNGTVKDTKTWAPGGLDLHDKEKTDGTKVITAFTLTLQPLSTPEPSGLVMAVIGGACLLGYARPRRGARRDRRAES